VRQFLLQMAGESGSGKSTLALAIGRATGAVVLDKDVVSGSLLGEGLTPVQAGGYAYTILFPLAGSILLQGLSVVLDSPAFWLSIPERGRELASRLDVNYRIVECRCDDHLEQEARLQSRPRLPTQPASRAELEVSLSRPGVVLTIAEPHLVVDSTLPIADCVARVMEYLEP
jgi:predicted kinase